ncbi:MAG: VOC family protein [bacterium]
MAVKPIPDGFQTITPYLYVKGAGQAIEFYKKAFDAVVVARMDLPGGQVGHSEIRLGNSMFMLSDEHPAMNVAGPETRGGVTASFYVYVENVDTFFAKAMAAGGTEIRPVQNMFWGDRIGVLRDPFGHEWSFATHVEDVSPEEMDKRMKAAMQAGACG